MTKKYKVVYFGTPEFSVPTLDLLANHPLIDLQFIVSMPDRPAGRGNQLHTPEVIQYAKEKNIPYFQTSNINKEPEFLDLLKSKNIDLFIILAFAQFLTERVLSIPAIGPFNIHTSILPKYRGAAPIQYALLNGDSLTGVSIQRMVKKLDAGDVVAFLECPIDPNDTYKTLSMRLSHMAPNCLNLFLDELSNNTVQYRPQDESQVTIAPTIKKEEGLIDFYNQSATSIYNHFRAFDPWPGIYTYINGKRAKLVSVSPVANQKLSPLQVVLVNDSILVGCNTGTISLDKIQLEGKKVSSGKDLFHGLRGQLQFTKEPS